MTLRAFLFVSNLKISSGGKFAISEPHRPIIQTGKKKLVLSLFPG
mgnify:CR=1 FL=1